MNSLFENLTAYLLGQSVHIVWLFLLVGVVCVALRSKSAHLRYLLWLLIIVKCLIPSLVTISLAILPEKAEPVVEQVVYEEATEPEVFIPAMTEYVPMVDSPVDTRGAFVQYITSLSKMEQLAFGWMAGAGIFLVVIFAKAMRTNMILTKNRMALPELLQAEVSELLGGQSGAVPKCYCMEGISQPFVWGLVRGSIYLPSDFMASTDGNHRRQILMHEMAHITRRDPVVNFLQIIAQVVFFFHPLVWVANKLIRAEREKCCDEAAIARLDASPKDYGRAIVDTLVNEYESTMPTPSMAIAGPVKNIENRIKTIMQPGRKFYKRPTVVALLIIMLVAAVTVPVGFALSNRPAKDPSSQLDKGTTKVYQVNRTVSDFSEDEDFSTPESAYAAINRIMAGEDYDAWQRVSVKRLAKSLAKDAQRRKKRKEKADPKWSKTVLNARILEVRIKDEEAVVIAELPQGYTSKPVKKTIDYRHLEFEDGKWLNTGENRYETIEQAREKFTQMLEKHSTEAAEQSKMEHKYREAFDNPEMLLNFTEELFKKIRKANYDKILSYYDERTGKWKRDGWKKLIPEKHYMTSTNFPGMVKWICENFKRNPIVSVELGDVFESDKKISGLDRKSWPAIPYKLTLKDGAVLEGDMLFRYYINAKGKGYWEAMLGLDWHLQDDPFTRDSDRDAVIDRRVESAIKLKNFGTALFLYAFDNKDKYPDSLEELESYGFDKELLAWGLKSVKYLGKGKKRNQPETIIAYDKSFLETQDGTTLLFSDGHVEFRKKDVNGVFVLYPGGREQPWEKVFYELYRLEDGEVLKRIAPPFIPERKDFYHDRNASQASAISEPPDYFTFHWDGELKNWGLGFMGRKGNTLSNVLRSSLSIPVDQFEGPKELLKLPVGGDWIVRKNISDAEKLRALEKILLEELGEEISFQKRKVIREVIVAKGKFKFSRPSGTYDDENVHFYSDKLDPDEGSGGGTAGTVADLINVLGQRTGLQVIDETRNSSRKINLPYGHHRSSRLRSVNNKDEKSTKLKMMLKNLEKQTNLRFTVEERTVSKWIVTGDGYENSTAVIGSYGGGMGGFGGIDPTNPLSFQPGHDPTEGKTEVSIEARIISVPDNFLEDISLELFGSKDPADDPDGKTNSEFLDDQQVEFIIKAANQHKEAKVLTSPRILVLDGEQASIKTVSEIPYTDGYTEVESDPEKPEAKIVYFEKGLTMDIEPHITEDRKNIRVKFVTKLSDISLGQEHLYKDKHPYHKPEISVTEIATHVIVPSNKTYIEGPIPSTAYYDADGTKVKQNILILLKATIIKNTTPQANLTPSSRGRVRGD